MGGGQKSQTVTQQNEPWSVQRPYLEKGFKEAEKIYDAQGYPIYYPNMTSAPISNETETALRGMTDRALAGSPLVKAGQNSLLATLNGAYLNGNAGLNQVIDTAKRGITKSYQEGVVPSVQDEFSRYGRVGSDAMGRAMGEAANEFGRTLADTESSLRYNDYGRERANQMSALGLVNTLSAADYGDLERLAGIGSAREQMFQDKINADIGRFNFYQDRPKNKLADYMALINGNYGGSMTSTQPGQRSNNLLTGLGAGVSLLGGLGNISSAGGLSKVFSGFFGG